MRVLVTEDELGGSNAIVADLRGVGHEVATCQPLGATVHPCLGLSGAQCPLAQHVDVAVAVHSGHSGRAITGREFGVICAARAAVPLVSVASRADNPLPGFPTTSRECIVPAVERIAARGTRPSPGELVAAIRQVLARHRMPCAPGTIVADYVEGPASYDLVVVVPEAVRHHAAALIEASARDVSEDGRHGTDRLLRHVAVTSAG